MAWNHPNSNSEVSTAKLEHRRCSGKYYIVAVFIAVVIGVFVWICLQKKVCSNTYMAKFDNDLEANSVKTSAPQNHSQTSSVGSVAIQSGSINIGVETNEWNSKEYPGEKIVSCTTNTSTGYILEVSQSPNGKKTVHIKEPPSIWKCDTDGLISAVLHANDSTEMPPLPPMGTSAHQRFLKSLKTPIEINPDDPSEVKTMKRIVASARNEIKARIDAGEYFNDILEDRRSLCNENCRIRQDAARELNRIRETGSDEDVIAYTTAVNGMFKKMGIKPLENRKRKIK